MVQENLSMFQNDLNMLQDDLTYVERLGCWMVNMYEGMYEEWGVD